MASRLSVQAGIGVRKFLRTNLLVVAITLAIGLALVVPEVGVWMRGARLTAPMIMLIFLCQGMGVHADELRQVGAYLRLLAIGFAVVHLLSPAAGLGVATLLGWSGDSRVGFVMMCCMAPTLVSGVVIAAQAGGNRTAAIILTVVLNLAAIVAIPLNLRWTLGSTAPIDQGSLLFQLVALILLPAAVGHGVAHARPAVVKRLRSWVTYLPVVLLGAIVFVSLSSQVKQLRGLGWGEGAMLAVGSLATHYFLLAAGYGGARWLVGAPIARCRSLAIVCSQKTLPVAVAVWTLVFQERYPLAIVPAIVFHLSQIYADGMLARYWGSHPVD